MVPSIYHKLKNKDGLLLFGFTIFICKCCFWLVRTKCHILFYKKKENEIDIKKYSVHLFASLDKELNIST